MISYELISPVSARPAGAISIQIEITSDNEPDGFEDSFKLSLNFQELSNLNVSEADGTWTIIKEVNLQGPQTVILSIESEDSDETKASTFTFDVNAEASYSTDLYYIAAHMRVLGEYFPEGTKARSDNTSIFQQLMNPLALKFDEERIKLNNHNRGINLDKFLSDDPDWLYQYILQTGEVFKKKLNTENDISYDTPIVYGNSGLNRFSLNAKDSFRELWNDLPARYTATSLEFGNTILSPSISLGEVALYEDIKVTNPGRIFIDFHSVSNTVNRGTELLVTKLKLLGLSPEGYYQEEDVNILKSGLISSQKLWKTIQKIEVAEGPINASAEFIIYNFPPRKNSKEDPFVRGANKERIHWSITDDDSGSRLHLSMSSNGYLQDIVRGEDTRSVIESFRLANVSNEDISIVDFSIDPTSYYIYGVDASKLYVWDRRVEYPENLTLLNESSTSPEVDFWIMKYNENGLDIDGTITTEFTIELERPRAAKLINRWHWSIIKPDGTRKYIDLDKAISEDAGPFWRENAKPVQQYGITEPQFTLTVEDCGTFILELTLEFFGGSQEVVRKATQVFRKKPVAEFKIDHIVTSSSANRIHIDDNGDVIIINSGNAWRLTPMYDSFLPDFKENRIFFREEFDSIEVDL